MYDTTPLDLSEREPIVDAFSFFITGRIQRQSRAMFVVTYAAENEALALDWVIERAARAFDVPEDQVIIDSVRAEL